MQKSLTHWGKRVAALLALVAKFIELHPLWSLVLTGGVSWLVAAQAWALQFFGDQRTQVSIGLFLVLLWTYIGLRAVATLNGVHRVKTEPEYRYALSPEGYTLGFHPNPEEKDLAFSLSTQFRNLSQHPIRITVDKYMVRIDDRVHGEPDEKIQMVLPRVTARILRSGGFKRELLEKAEQHGTLDVSISYGPPEGPPVRRYEFRTKLAFSFPKGPDGKVVNASVTEMTIWEQDSDIQAAQ